jgi:putative AdoMet-dependent methyltransferase
LPDSSDRQELFDRWAADYDPAADDVFPFGGYDRVLDRVTELVAEREPRRVLELGVGTGTLTQRLRERLPDAAIVGLDFSSEMVGRAAGAVPGVELVTHDLRVLPLPLETRGCDVAAMSYVLHEFDDGHKARLLEAVLESLAMEGVCVIGDVCFADAATREAASVRLAAHWDPEEHYVGVEELSAILAGRGLRVGAEQLGDHAGVVTVSRI